MDQLNWTDDLSVKMGEIDNQHKEMIRLINNLDHTMMTENWRDASIKALAGLADYASHHFASEEGYFDQFGYKETTQHKTEHGFFIAKITEFQNELESGRMILPVEITGFLKDWLVDHIKESDQIYVECFLRQVLV